MSDVSSNSLLSTAGIALTRCVSACHSRTWFDTTCVTAESTTYYQYGSKTTLPYSTAGIAVTHCVSACQSRTWFDTTCDAADVSTSDACLNSNH